MFLNVTIFTGALSFANVQNGAVASLKFRDFELKMVIEGTNFATNYQMSTKHGQVV